MAQRLLLDTDVLIDYLRGVPVAVGYLEDCTEVLLISATSGQGCHPESQALSYVKGGARAL